MTKAQLINDLAEATEAYRAAQDEVRKRALMLSRARAAFDAEDPQARGLIVTAEKALHEATKVAMRAHHRYATLSDALRREEQLNRLARAEADAGWRRG